MWSVKSATHLIPYIIIVQIQSGHCMEDYPLQTIDTGNNMESPHSLSISKDWALHFDRELGRDDETLSESKKIEIENNLIEVAELLHFVPPGFIPRKGPQVFYPHPLDHAAIPTEVIVPAAYSLKGTKPPPVAKDVKLPVPFDLEPSFTLALEVTTSKPKVIGHISKSKSDSELSAITKPPVHETPTTTTTTTFPKHDNHHDDAGIHESLSQTKIHPAQERLSHMHKLRLNLKGNHKLNPKFNLFADSRQRKNPKEM